MHMRTLAAVHRTAIQTSIDVVSAVRPAHLDLPTPCAGWTLADLLTHMTAQHHGFAAAARGHGADHDAWDTAPFAAAIVADPAGTYTAAARDALQAFAVRGIDEMPFALPEFGADVILPGKTAMGFHFVDYVVHAWDVSVSLGLPFGLPAEVIDTALPLVLAVPDNEFRDGADSPFAHAVQPAAADSDFARILRHLGRNPNWAPAGSAIAGA